MLEDIITDVLNAEGRGTYTNHPADKGGPTKWGITQVAWAGYRGRSVTVREIRGITEPQARDFYEKLYVIGPHFNLLPDLLVPLVVDSAVNSGARAAAKWVQRAVGAKQDGKVGPKTIAAAQQGSHIATFLRVVSYRVKLYGRLVSKDPKLKLAKDAGFHLQAEFAAGWNNRAMAFIEELAQTLD